MTTPFTLNIKVTHKDIDGLNHVNNEVYLNWLILAATSHSRHLGWNFQSYLARGEAFVVRRHELDYLASAVLDDDLIIETWIESIERAKSVRVYKIIRQRDQKIIMEAKTLWVYISMTTGKSKDIPEDIRASFFPTIIPPQKKIMADLSE